jgi:hypothetical protein
MMNQSIIFPDVFSKPVVVEFSEESLSSDGGSLLLSALDRKFGLTAIISSCLKDERQEGKVQHDVLEMVQQRVFSIANGYEDCNDAAKLGADPVLKTACGLGAVNDDTLASQPTLCRFENSVSAGELQKVGCQLAETVISIQKNRRKGKKTPKVITIDMDPYCDPTYGGQQLTFFNGFYDNYCYLPQLATLCFDDESTQYAVAAILRPGNKGAKHGVIPILNRLLPLLRKNFPKSAIRFRADANFSGEEIFAFLEKEKIGYYIGVGGNSVLKGLSAVSAEFAQLLHNITGEKETRYSETMYQAGSWSKARRVVFKAEVLTLPGREPKVNQRYVVTNLRYSSKNTFSKYHLRGDMENRIKELKLGLRIDRTSCTEFRANQFRILLTLAAFILYQILQDKLAGSEFEKAQVWTIRERLFKIAARVTESSRRIVLYFTDNYPWKTEWLKLAASLGAV